MKMLCIDTPDVPILAMSAIDAHFKAVIEITRSALKSTNLAGILFLIPLRIAGARAQITKDRAEILESYEGIIRRGSLVGDAFIDDLRPLWSKGEMRKGQTVLADISDSESSYGKARYPCSMLENLA